MANYSPKTLADIVIGDEFSNDAVRYIANGNLPFPSTGKNGFLIHGPFGTGKSTLAMLMPSELEKLHGNPASPFVWSQQADDDAKVKAKIVDNLSTAVNFINVTPSKFSHYVIDELDEFSKAHQKKIRTAMNACNDNIFYFTTNNVNLIDGGIRNRCYEIHMCAALPEQWLPLFNRVLADRGLAAPAAASVLPIIQSCSGSVRDIVASANMLAAKATNSIIV
jgi:replication-associated recombination protein RarA